MDDANLIACLYAADSDPLGCSHAAICSSDNQARYFPAQQKASNAFSRESTASLDSDEDSYQALTHLFKPGLQLTFNPGPKSGAAVGFVVGTDAKSCDIIVPNLKGISARHCYFTFNAKRQFIVYDFSHNGSIVTYDGKLREKRRDFPWILSGDKALETTKIIVIQIHPHVRFQIVVPRQKTQLYRDNLDRFLEETAADDGLRLGGLGIQSKISTAAQSGECTPSQNPLYLPQGELGKGSFGLVTRVWDVSAGIMRASKEFHNITKSNWRREASIMRRVSHPHIVELIRVLETPSPRLILEYLPLGNLEDQNRKQRISERESLIILRQGLNALNCLHEEGIVHRDIKPENILVETRDRVSFHIKLSDFGLSKADGTLKTAVGTYIYAAAEVFESSNYSSACDIWSLGVVVFQYGYSLPPNSGQERGRRWCQTIIRTLNDWDSDPLIDFLSNNMLVFEPERRYSAEDCYPEALCLPDPSLEHSLTPMPASYADKNQATVAHQPAGQAVESFDSIRSSEIRKYIRSNTGHANSDASESNASTVILETRKR